MNAAVLTVAPVAWTVMVSSNPRVPPSCELTTTVQLAAGARAVVPHVDAPSVAYVPVPPRARATAPAVATSPMLVIVKVNDGV